MLLSFKHSGLVVFRAGQLRVCVAVMLASNFTIMLSKTYIFALCLLMRNFKGGFPVG